jgi:hypothetical protein
MLKSQIPTFLFKSIFLFLHLSFNQHYLYYFIHTFKGHLCLIKLILMFEQRKLNIVNSCWNAKLQTTTTDKGM